MILNKTNSNDFEDIKVNFKIKLSALWTSVTLCYLYGDYFELYIPQKVEGLISGDNMLDSPMKLFAASVLLAIPAVMVCLSMLLKPALNRWLNILFGVFFTAIMVLIAFDSLTEWRTFYGFLALVESIITSLIVWFAWNCYKQTNRLTEISVFNNQIEHIPDALWQQTGLQILNISANKIKNVLPKLAY